MRPVDRYRAWALRGKFLLHHNNGVVKVRWPNPMALLAHNPSDSLATKLVRLADRSAEQLVELAGEQDAAVLELIVADLAEYFGCTRGHRLLTLIDRYGDAIAADLDQVYGLDVLDVFRGQMVPDEVMGRIDKFPRHSRLSEALAQDDELAALSSDDDTESRPSVREIPFTEWTPEVERLTLINDRLGEILTAIGSAVGTKINVPPEPRPVGANTRLEAKKDDDHYMEVVADVAAAHARYVEAFPNETPEEG